MSDVPRYVLDTSAILTLIEDEDGADRVEEILRSGKVLLPWTVLLEINYITRQESGETEADRRYAMLRESPVTILWNVDEQLILAASRMKARHRISFADSMILAYTLRNDAVLIHKDPEFDALAEQVAQEQLQYKRKAE